ncbi:MAG: DUF6265 family protein [Bacteroidales bacterium]|jgi:hypothetical protein|nr:DUF6265 family protein [Bacteroidales bacterium]
MKIKTSYLVLIFTMTSIMSCNNSTNSKTDDIKSITYAKIENASWLIGQWQNNTTKGNLQEIWEKKNDSTLNGISFFIVGKDTISSETISLEERSNELFYIPIVKNQNDGQAIKFRLTSLTTNQLVFENPNHDFPQKITYNQISNDSLIAVISGIKNGTENSQNFPMTRTQ